MATKKKDERTYGGAAVAAGGAGLAVSTPAGIGLERRAVAARKARIDRRVAHIQRTMPKSAGARRGLTSSGKQAQKLRRTSAPSSLDTAPIRLQRKAAYRALHELASERKLIKPRLGPRSLTANLVTAGVGVPVSYMGARHQLKVNEKHPVSKGIEPLYAGEVSKKDDDQKKLAAGYLGAAGGAAAYQGAGYAFIPKEKKWAKQIKTNPKHAAKFAEHQAKMPPGATKNSPEMRNWFKTYPKSLPGGRVRRILTHTHTGKTGVAATLGAAGLTGAGAVAAAGHKKKPVSKSVGIEAPYTGEMSKRIMSDAEIRRRKKLQSHISLTTGTLGLTALGGTLLATKRGGKASKAAFKAINRTRPKSLHPKNLSGHTAPILATSAGIGGVGAFNFASYTNAESRKRKAAMPVTPKKTVTKSWDEPYVGEIGKAEAWTPVSSTYDPEEKRQKRGRSYPKIASGISAGLAAGAVGSGTHAAFTHQQARKAKADAESYASKKKLKAPRSSSIYRGMQESSHSLKRLGHARAKTAAALAGGAVVAAGAAPILHHRSKSKSWESYEKRDSRSAFGVDHLSQ